MPPRWRRELWSTATRCSGGPPRTGIRCWLAARARAGELFVSRVDGSVIAAVVAFADDVWGPDVVGVFPNPDARAVTSSFTAGTPISPAR